MKKEEDINEIILQKQNFINEKINENNISKKEDTNNFKWE